MHNVDRRMTHQVARHEEADSGVPTTGHWSGKTVGFHHWNATPVTPLAYRERLFGREVAVSEVREALDRKPTLHLQFDQG